jgi:hypothetical protein
LACVHTGGGVRGGVLVALSLWLHGASHTLFDQCCARAWPVLGRCTPNSNSQPHTTHP